MRLISAIAALSFAVTGVAAGAVTVFSENFNAAGFVGASLSSGDTSDRFGSTDYTFINNFNGFVFNTSNTFLAIGAGGDGALLLNENSGGGTASRTISGLTIGKIYTVSLLLSGDNRPGDSYTLEAAIDGNNVSSTPGIVLASGANPGTTVSFSFAAAGTSALLALSQTAAAQGSPIVDDILVTAVPEPATWGLLIAGFAMVGVAARRRRTAFAA